jgi:hypothetical protein
VTAIHHKKTTRPFREIMVSDADVSALSPTDLREEMDAHGYVLIRGLLAPKDLDPLLRGVTEVLHDAGWLNAESDPYDRVANMAVACFEDDAPFKVVYDRVFCLPSFHALPHHPVLQLVMKMLVGQHLLIHPKSVGRLIFPNFDRAITHAHQDHTAVAGDEETFTAWDHSAYWVVPTGLACSPLMGRLVVSLRELSKAVTGLAAISARVICCCSIA